jgi:uncharacterized membrane protein
MDVISEALGRVHRRLDAIDARLARLEGREVSAMPVEAAPEPAAPAIAIEPPPPEPEPQPFTPPAPPPEPAAAEAQPEPVMETRMGLTWVNRIGVVTLLLGAAFFFKYAVDNDWIGPGGRVALGVLAGLAALGIGEVLWKRAQKLFAQGMTGLGIALLYLSFFASFGFYHLLPQAAAFVLMAVTTTAAGVLSIRYGARAVAVLGLLGGYATPVLLSTGRDAPWVLFGYVALLNLGAAWIARKKRWHAVAGLSIAATALLYVGWHDRHYAPEKALVATLFAFVFYAEFAAQRYRPLFAAAQAAAALALVKTISGTYDNALLGELGLLAVGLGFTAWMGWPSGYSFVVGSWWLAYAFAQTDVLAIIVPQAFWALSGQVVIALGWIVLAGRRRLLEPQELVTAGANAAAYYAVSYALLKTMYGGWLGLLALAVAALHLAAAYKLREHITEKMATRTPVLFTAALALAFVTLAVPVQLKGFSITMVWAAEMAVLAWISTRIAEPRFVYAVHALGALVFLRLWAYDLAGLRSEPLLFASGRFMAFLAAAAGYALAAYWLRKQRIAAVYYALAHLVMLWNLIMEALDWAGRAFAAENRLSAETLSASAVMAFYGLVLVIAGVATRTVLNRIMGLILFALVVVKLYLFDVWQLRLTFRIAAFLGLGAVLVLSSYFYSRYRSKVESFWRKDAEPAS